MRYVLVNGQLAVDAGKATGVLAGRPLRHVSGVPSPKTAGQQDYAAHVEIRRTTNGVPHIKADNIGAAEYALAYVQSEDYGARVPLDLLKSRGEMGRWFGRDSMERDFGARLAYERAVETYAFVDADTREAYEGFAAGANRYVELHPDEFPAGFAPKFTGYDVLAHDVYMVSATQAARFLSRNDPSVPHAQRGQQPSRCDADVGRSATRRSVGRHAGRRARMRGRSRRRAPSRGTPSCSAIRISSGTPDTTKRTSPFQASSISTVTSASADHSASSVDSIATSASRPRTTIRCSIRSMR
jgi:acyl-homoserine-lactone acylase